MLRFLTFVVPFLLKGATKGPVKTLIGRSTFYAIVFFGIVFLLAALFVWVAKTYSLEIAFLTLGLLFLGFAVLSKLVEWVKRRAKRRKSIPKSMENDALAELLPDSLTDDPAIQNVLKKIGAHPVIAVGTAVALGAILAREFLNKD